VRGIRHQQLEGAVAQDVPHRLPVNPGRLHCHVAASRSRQPGQQVLKSRRRGVERAALAADPGVHHDPHAGDDRLLVHIKAGYTLMNDVHPFSSHTDAAGVVT
jgi:hypothetical protein